MLSDKTGVMDETAVTKLAKKTSAQKLPPCSTLEVYDETPILIYLYITEDVVKSVAQKLSGSSGTGGMDSEALQEWLLKFREDRKKIVLVLKFLLTG